MDCLIPLTLCEVKAGNSTLAYQRAVTFYCFWEYCLQYYKTPLKKLGKHRGPLPFRVSLACPSCYLPSPLHTPCEHSRRFQEILTTSTALRFWQWSLFPHWGKVLHLCPLLSVPQQTRPAFHFKRTVLSLMSSARHFSKSHPLLNVVRLFSQNPRMHLSTLLLCSATS